MAVSRLFATRIFTVSLIFVDGVMILMLALYRMNPCPTGLLFLTLTNFPHLPLAQYRHTCTMPSSNGLFAAPFVPRHKLLFIFKCIAKFDAIAWCQLVGNPRVQVQSKPAKGILFTCRVLRHRIFDNITHVWELGPGFRPPEWRVQPKRSWLDCISHDSPDVRKCRHSHTLGLVARW